MIAHHVYQGGVLFEDQRVRAIEEAMQAGHGAIDSAVCTCSRADCAECRTDALHDRHQRGVVGPGWRTVRGYRPITFPIGSLAP